MKKFVRFLLFSFLVCSCANKDSGFNESIRMSGDNKEELMKVVDHFKQNPADSLKLQAAMFLIDHMKWHHGFLLEKSMEDSLFNVVKKIKIMADSVLILRILNPGKNGNFLSNHAGEKLQDYKNNIDLKSYFHYNKNEIKPLLTFLTGDFLIKHIDERFKLWERLNEQYSITFEIFLNEVLPLQIVNEAISNNLHELGSIFRNKFYGFNIENNRIDSIIPQMNLYFTWFQKKADKQIDLGVYSFLNNSPKSCDLKTISIVNLFRSMGVLCNMDYFPNSLDTYSQSHFWCNVYLPNNKSLYFDALSNSIGAGFNIRSIGKVYRKTFSGNKDMPFFKKKREEVIPPEFSSPCFIDVTNKYFNTCDILVPVNRIVNVNVLYFCVSVNNEWSPINFGFYNKFKKEVLFKDMVYNTSGCVMKYKNNTFIPVSDFLYIEKDGSCTPIKPEDHFQNIVIRRKYPWKKRMRDFGERSIGNYIQASNNYDFSNAQTIDSIDFLLKPQAYHFNGSNGKKFKYYRIITPKPWKKLHTAVVRFLRIHNDSLIQSNILSEIRGEIIGEGLNFEKVFDNNWETYAESNWSGMAFNEPVAVDKIEVVPRNANNGIVINDTYELFYWDNEWISLKKILAKSDSLVITSKYNSVFMLKNLSRGNESLPFIYKNNKQYFINFDTLNIASGNCNGFHDVIY